MQPDPAPATMVATRVPQDLQHRLLHRTLPHLELLWSLVASSNVYYTPEHAEDLATLLTALRLYDHLTQSEPAV